MSAIKPGFVVKEAQSYTCHLWMAGDYNEARAFLRRHVIDKPDCYSIMPASYIYTGGEEQGFRISLITYPRIPREPEEIAINLELIGIQLCEHLGQGSFTVETPQKTSFFSRRAVDKDLEGASPFPHR